MLSITIKYIFKMEKDTKLVYVAPKMEVVEVELESVVAASSGVNAPGLKDEYQSGPARAPRRDFWGSGEK